jgi:Leucine-rich repeat (LRR) protein
MALLPKYNLSFAKKAKEPAIELVINLPKTEKQLDEAFAMPNVQELMLNVESGFGEIPESIKNAPILQTLRIENLKKYKGKAQIPDVLLELPQINYLSISDSPNLIFGEKSWEKMIGLTSLNLYGSGTGFPIGMTKALNLKSISLNCEYEIPDELGNLSNLELLHLSIFSLKAPEAITRLSKLKDLSMFCSEFPTWIGKCSKKLKKIFVYTRDTVKEIPEDVFEYPELEALEICSSGLEYLSPKVAQLKSLKKLRLSRNQFSQLPEELVQLENLERLDIEFNKFNNIPGLIIRIPNLKELNLKGAALHDSEISRFEKFYAWIKDGKNSAEDLAFFADVWDKKALPIADLYIQKLEKALNSGIIPLNAHALYYLTELSEKAYCPFKAGDVLFIDAKTAFKKTELKEKLGALNITLASAYNEQVTHVLIDENSNTDYETALMTELQLTAFLNENKPDYLVESVQQDSGTLDNITSMLYSLIPANVEVAFSLMKSGGVPEGTVTALFTVYKLSNDKDQCSKALKFLQKIASPNLASALKKRVDFKKTRHSGEYKTNISVFENTELDLIRFGLAYTKASDEVYALESILKQNNPIISKEFLLLISSKGILNLNLEYYKIKDIPDCIYEFDHIKKLRLVVSKKASREDLKSIEKLKSLEELELDDSLKEIVMFAPAFMNSLEKLPNLKKIRVYGMSAETKAFLEKHLPNCQLQS